MNRGHIELLRSQCLAQIRVPGALRTKHALLCAKRIKRHKCNTSGINFSLSVQHCSTGHKRSVRAAGRGLAAYKARSEVLRCIESFAADTGKTPQTADAKNCCRRRNVLLGLCNRLWPCAELLPVVLVHLGKQAGAKLELVFQQICLTGFVAQIPLG